ncbi:hypothetical protein BZF66_05765 [Salmonella enterica]|uniref:hypothetical protein n=1 Tax=Salmonella enterica TaxID=28901 RepID=UPI003A7FF157|nr:hypothetical protein [Salmonella enterica]
MIPFAKILTYGNEAVKPTAVRKIAHALDTYILWYDGTLWGAGYNRYGQISRDGSTSAVKSYVVVDTGVTDIIDSWNSGIAYRKGDTIYGAGDIAFTGNTRGTQEPVDITNLIGVGGNKPIIKFSITNNTVFGITEDDDLYGLAYTNSRGVLGTGNTTDHRTYIKLASNVKYVTSSSNNSFYIDNNGILFGTGWNQGGSLGYNGTTQSNTWTNINSIYNFDKVDGVSSANNSTWIVLSDGTIYSTGAQATGRGSASNTFVPLPNITKVTPENSYILGTSNNTFNAFVSMNKDSDNPTIYFSGNLTYMGAGTDDSNLGLWTTNLGNSGLNPSKVKGYFGNESSVWYDENKMFFCGQQRFVVGYPSTPATVQFKELSFPPGTTFKEIK